MDRKLIKLFFALLRSVLCGTTLSEEEKLVLSSDKIEKLLALAEKHDVSHLLALALKQNGLLTKEDSDKEKPILMAIYRFEKLRYALSELSEVLEKEKISYIPLKGSVLRSYYPEEWMRTSCDIDILVNEKNLDHAFEAITEQLQYTNNGKGSHDVQLLSPNGVHAELHYDLIEEGRASNAVPILNTIWDKAIPCHKDSCCYELSDAMFYFYHIAHMAKHFEDGGCGVRPFIDLWILDRLESADVEEREKLLQSGDLLKFAISAQKLSRVWLENAEQDAVTRKMETYILSGGMYGNTANRVLAQQGKRGGKVGYALSRIFLSYDILKYVYPILQRHKWLYPAMQMRRWCRPIFCGRLRRSVNELRVNMRLTKEQSKSVQSFLEELGL